MCSRNLTGPFQDQKSCFSSAVNISQKLERVKYALNLEERAPEYVLKASHSKCVLFP